MYIQELSETIHLSKKAIHLYEEKGLIHPQKDEKGYRIYNENEKNILIKIKLLRQMNFSIAEIKEILINQQFQFFEKKKKEYQNEIYDIETSIQYIDQVKESMEQDDDINILMDDMERVYQLKNIHSSFHKDIDFQKIIFFLLIAIFICEARNYEILSLLFVIITLSISMSVKVRVMIFHIYEKLRK